MRRHLFPFGSDTFGLDVLVSFTRVSDSVFFFSSFLPFSPHEINKPGAEFSPLFFFLLCVCVCGKF